MACAIVPFLWVWYNLPQILIGAKAFGIFGSEVHAFEGTHAKRKASIIPASGEYFVTPEEAVSHLMENLSFVQ